MAFVNFYYELDVYIISRKLASEVYRISKLFPAEERYSLTDQIRRSSRSIGAQIAESWAKRRYENHFISKLTDMTMLSNMKPSIGSKSLLIVVWLENLIWIQLFKIVM